MKIAVIMPNWVGDCIMTFPALLYLQQNNYDIYLYGKKWLGQIFSGLTKNIYSLNELSSFKNKNTEANKNYCIVFPNSFESALKARLAKLKPIGYRRDGRSLLLHKGFSRKKNHEAEIFYRLVFLSHVFFTDKKNIAKKEKKIVFEINQHFFLPLEKKVEQKTEKILAKINNFFLLCPLSHNKGNGKSKNYPEWKNLLLKLLEKYSDNQFVFCPGPNEMKELVNQFGDLLENPKVNVIEDTRLDEYLGIIRKANIVIANDSGPMHLASVSNVAIIGLFGVTDPNKTKPIGDKAYFLGSQKGWVGVEEILLKVEEIF